MSNLTLFCLLDGDAPSQSFPVTAQRNITVGEFKELVKIKKSARFKDVDADDLTLWRVSIPVNDDNEDHPIALNVFEGRKVKLRPTTRLCTVYTEELPEETIHFMVQPQSAPSAASSAAVPDLGRDFLPVRELQAQFQRKYNDPNNIVKNFKDSLDNIAKIWERTKYYAPMTSIVQSSGVGKTRIIREVAQERYVFYCCLRPKKSTGFPPRSSITKELLSEKACNTEFYASYLLACIRVFAEVLTEYKQTFKKQMTPAIWFDWHVFGVKFDGSTNVDQFWSRVKDKMGNMVMNIDQDRQLQQDIFAALRSIETYVKASEVSVARLLFVFDEARNLNTLPTGGKQSHFYWLRLALRLLPAHGDKVNFNGTSMESKTKDVYTAAVFLDTSSRVGNFVPPASHDPSARVNSRMLEVFPPFYLVGTFDTLACPTTINSLSDATDEKRLISLGRPLWYTTWDAFTSNMALETVRIAREKIMCTSEILPSEKIDLDLALAILSPRVALDVNPALHISSTLVADHMRMCVFITPDRECMLSAAPSEPILAEASAQLMRLPGYLTKILDSLAVSLRYGIVDAGYRGELVAQLLVLLALDRVAERKGAMPNSRVVTVNDFLKELLGSDYAEVDNYMDENAKKQLMEGEIFLTHFTRPTYRPNQEQLCEFAVRGTGILCKRNTEKSDMEIPFVLNKRTVPLNNKISKLGVSKLVVQVKNRKLPKTGERSRIQMAPEKVGLGKDVPYGVIWMELGLESSGITKLAGCSARNPVEPNLLGLVVNGLGSYPCVNDENASLLRRLLESWPDPEKLASTPAEKDAVKNMLPLQYESTSNAQC